MKSLAYYVFVVTALCSATYLTLSLAEGAIKRQDIICQEGC